VSYDGLRFEPSGFAATVSVQKNGPVSVTCSHYTDTKNLNLKISSRSNSATIVTRLETRGSGFDSRKQQGSLSSPSRPDRL